MGGSNLITIPNLLTLARLIFTFPVFWGIVSGRPLIAVIFIFLAGLSDFFDGFLARKLKQESQIGKIADPFVDKFFGGLSLIGLAMGEYIPWLIFWLFLARDLFLVAVSLILIWQHKELVAETKVGKFSTGLFVFSLVLIVAKIPYAPFLFYGCFSLYVLSGLLYSIRIFQSPEASSVKKKAVSYIRELKQKAFVGNDPQEEDAKGKTRSN
jgi:CDP-diacylglycerol--glycerol-3-phosphate 3-phosphatidyltransferase